MLVVLYHGGSAAQWWRFAVFGQNFWRDTVGTVDGPMWSLVVELQFYILLPVLALAIRAVARRSFGRAGLFLGALALASLAVRVSTVALASHPDIRWAYSLPATFLFFVSGLSLALVRVRWTSQYPSWLKGPLRHSDLWILASVPLWLVTFWRYNLDATTAVASFLVVGAAALPLKRGTMVRCLDWRPLAILGTASYSLYMWHLPIVEHVARAGWSPAGFLPLLALLLPICLVVGLASYVTIEAPFLRLRRSWSGRSRTPPAPVVAPAAGTTPAAGTPAAGTT
jgi:peptidoglycan/LPS O-acetylase OafA/YrhL